MVLDASSHDVVSPEQGESQTPEAKPLRCAVCGHAITYEAQRISVQGSHEHLRRNPQGLSFRFGCFAWAPGCAKWGEATSEYTWFPGFSWRIAACAQCREHLGWSFSSRSGEGFYGLILARLVHDP
ncbi:MAG: cereblon family protein [Gammaproteobacteria bacterium]